MLVSHQDQVVELPPVARRIAGSDFCSCAAFQVGEYALGFQGHPEFDRNFSRVLLELRRATIGERLYCEGLASLANDVDSSTVARWILTFMRGR